MRKTRIPARTYAALTDKKAFHRITNEKLKSPEELKQVDQIAYILKHRTFRHEGWLEFDFYQQEAAAIILDCLKAPQRKKGHLT